MDKSKGRRVVLGLVTDDRASYYWIWSTKDVTQGI